MKKEKKVDTYDDLFEVGSIEIKPYGNFPVRQLKHDLSAKLDEPSELQALKPLKPAKE